MTNIGKLLFSTRMMGILLLLFAASMAVATFVENDYGTPVAKALIYNHWWFETIMVLLTLNFIGNINRYQLFRREKWPLLVFHIAFILIMIGAGITRYISFDGMMHIREGEQNNEIVSNDLFFKVQISDGEEALAYEDIPTFLIPNNIPSYLKLFRKNFNPTFNFKGKHVTMRMLDYIPRAQDSLVASPNGKQILQLVTLINGQRENVYLNAGSVQMIQNILVAYNKETPGAINLNDQEGQLTISSPFEGNYMVMATQTRGELKGTAEKEPFNLRSLYTVAGLTFVVPQGPQKGELQYLEGDKRMHESDPDLIKMELSTDKAIDTAVFYGGRGLTGFQQQAEIDGLTITMGYGSKVYTTPFELKLDRFEMEKYPGSQSPASYSSYVKIVDDGKEEPYHIFMNHVLDHKGYRFFQSTFDPDEKGTGLSVNHDYWGTNVTYIGYTLLFLGMFVTLFWKGTRFSKLNNQLKMLSKQKIAALLCFALSIHMAFGQQIDMHGPSEGNQLQTDSMGHDHNAMQQMFSNTPQDAAQFAASIHIDKTHSDNFGSLLVQNFDGRIEPVNTLALEILRKLYHKDHFYELDANQFLLSISTQPFDWIRVPFIKVGTRGGQQLLQTAKADAAGYTSLVNLLLMGEDGQPHFILEADFQKAFAKKASEQDNYDKELIELNDKLEVVQYLISGQYMRVIPVPNDANNTWIAWGSEHEGHQSTATSPYAEYLKAVIYAQHSNDWNKANQQLQQVKDVQYQLGKKVIPSQAKINWEIRYNTWNVFFKLMIAYALLGTIILVLAFVKLFAETKLLNRIIFSLLALVAAASLTQAIGLGIRWYISGHEPWSNGYEAVMFISWIGIVAGLALYRNSNAFIPAAGCLVAVILMGFAHGGSQMNPQITPLVPVLKSYWLMVHVAIITSSYGFFGLSALIGAVVLLLYIVKGKKIAQKVDNSILELSIVNEMSLTVGLFLLTIGTFLGGIWANESWGRYWSWDPKETWAFISVIVYAFVLHIRLIPKMQSRYLFNLLSLVSFSSVIMTYFGVNYYLSGLHSYAKGDPVPVPGWVYITIALITVLAIISYFRYKHYRDITPKIPMNKEAKRIKRLPIKPAVTE